MTHEINDNTRLKTDNELPYKLIQGPFINANDNDTTATEVIIIRGSDVKAFYLESFPLAYKRLSGPNAYWTKPKRRRMPKTNFVTTNLKFEPITDQKPGDPFGNDPNAGPATAVVKTYEDYYRVTIDYRAMKDEDALEHFVTVGGEFLAVNPHKTDMADIPTYLASQQELTSYLANNPGVIKETADKLVPMIKGIPVVEHILRWDMVLDPPWDVFIANLGRVNSEPSTIGTQYFFGALAETVMFMGVSGNQKRLWDGDDGIVEPWTLDFRFSQRVIVEGGVTYGWNHVWVPKSQKWERLLRGANKEPLHEFFDPDDLFKMIAE